MERIKREHLDDRTQVVSSMLNGMYVHVERRYDYTALDLYDKSGKVDTLTAGTARQVYEYLGAMIRALEIVGR